MKLIIGKNESLLSHIEPIFVASYEHLIHEKTKETLRLAFEQCLFSSVLYDGEQVVAFALHRSMICSNWQNPPDYLADSPEPFRKYIENRFDIMTIEFLTVAPERLGKFSKVQPADLMLGLAINFMRESTFTAAMGFSRQDTKVDILTTRFGTKFHGEVERHGIRCSVVLVEDYNVTPHPIARTEQKVQEILAARVNHLPYLERKKAA